MISCIVFFSSFAGSGIQVMLGSGAVYFAMTLIGMYKNAKEYLPVRITDSVPLYRGEYEPKDYFGAVIVTAVLSFVFVLVSLPITDKRQI